MEHLVSASPVAALVGAGSIAPFHVAALRAAGFDLRHIAARRGSTRAPELAREWSIPEVWSDPAELISSGNWDAIVLAASTEATPNLLRLALRTERPCLVEKPVSFDPVQIREFLGNDSKLRVAYNRRHYESVRAARHFAGQGTCMFRLELPDGVGTDADELQGLRSVRENSVHGLDLLACVVGRYEVERVFTLGNPRGRMAVVTTEFGHVGSIVLNWNCPANFSLILDRAPHRFELRPFELGKLFQGMEVIEPTPELPVRRYTPKVASEVNSFPGSDGIKPGFLSQAIALKRRVTAGSWDDGMATIDDAAFAAEVAAALIAG
jgi:hypothetical protein